MDTSQPASWDFFASVGAAYASTCILWLAGTRLRPKLWPQAALPPSTRRWVDLALVVVAVALILLLGQVYRAGWLLPTAGQGWLSTIAWLADNLIIYLPIFIILAIRRQGPETVFLSPKGLPIKLASGAVLGLIGVSVLLLCRGQITQLGDVLVRCGDGRRLANFLPVFLEGVALAFVFVRLRWAFGLPAALAVPAVLFALAHVPGQLEGGLSPAGMVAFFCFNAVLVAAILYVAQRSGDIVWLGLVHYVMDVAIEAF